MTSCFDYRIPQSTSEPGIAPNRRIAASPCCERRIGRSGFSHAGHVRRDQQFGDFQPAKKTSSIHPEGSSGGSLRMRAIINVLVTTVAIGLNTGQLQAAPAGAQVQQSVPSLKLLVQADRYDEGYLPSCSSGLFYACYVGPDGGRRCGCWPGGYRPVCPRGYHYECRPNRYNPNARPYCGCY